MKAIRFLAITVISALVFTGCSKDEPAIDPATGGGDIVFNIGFAPQIQTLVATDVNFVSTWETGDEIGIFAVKRVASDTKALAVSDNYIHNVKLTMQADGKWTTASDLWHASGSEVLDFYAYYPYDATATNPMNITFNVNVDQTVVANYNKNDLLSANATAIAKGAAVDLQFKHMLSLVQVAVDPAYIDRNGGFTATLRGCKAGGVFNLGAGSLATAGDAVAVKMLRVESDPATATTYTYRALVPAQTVAQNTNLCQMVQNEQLYSSPKLIADLILTSGDAKLYTTTLPIAAIQTVKIPAGTFMMGSSDGLGGNGMNPAPAEPGRGANEIQHEVTLTKDFHMSKYAITNAQYAPFLNAKNIESDGKYTTVADGEQVLITVFALGLKYENNEWSPQTNYENFPVINVSWYGAVAYCEWLSEQTGLTYRLPTEAEWEYACRGDYPNKATEAATQPFGVGDGSKLYADMANFTGTLPYELPGGHIDGFTGDLNHPATSLNRSTSVGSYAANNYGLYDMHGNVWEWCSDWLGNYAVTAISDPTGVVTGTRRVFRGGSLNAEAQNCRSAIRNSSLPASMSRNTGFRVVFVP